MSNLTLSGRPSSIRAFAERMGHTAVLSKAKQHAAATGHAIRQGGEALVVGGLLGAAAQQLPTGLDVNVQGKFKVPVDAVAGVLAMGAAVALPGEEYSTDLRNAGSTCIAIFAFRQTQAFVAKKKGESVRVAGEFDFGTESHSDPLIAYANKHL